MRLQHAINEFKEGVLLERPIWTKSLKVGEGCAAAVSPHGRTPRLPPGQNVAAEEHCGGLFCKEDSRWH